MWIPSKHGVLVIEMGLLGVGDKELGAVGISTRIGHGHDSTHVMLQGGPEFIGELLAPEAGTAFPSTRGVTGLHHESPDIPMEQAIVIVIRCAQSEKVLFMSA